MRRKPQDSHPIKIETDARGEVTVFKDGNPPGLNVRDAWDILSITDQTSGATFDLRLHTAAVTGEEHLAEKSLREGADLELLQAVEAGELDVVRDAVGAGANVNAIRYLGIEFSDGRKLRCECLDELQVVVPAGYRPEDIKSVDIPFDQSSPGDLPKPAEGTKRGFLHRLFGKE